MPLKIKMLLIGPDNTDKTRMMLDIVASHFKADYKSTVGVDVFTKKITNNRNEEITLSIWDIGNQKRFDFIKSTFYKGAKGSIYVFDLSNSDSWELIKNWIHSTENFTGVIPFLLFGRKNTSGNEVDIQDDKELYNKFAEEEGGFYIELINENISIIEESIELLTNEITDRLWQIENQFDTIIADISRYLRTEEIRSYLNTNSEHLTDLILQKKMDWINFNKYIRGIIELINGYNYSIEQEGGSKILYLSKITDKKIEYLIDDISDLLQNRGLRDSMFRNYPKFVTYYTQFEKRIINSIDILKKIVFEL